MSGCGVLAVLLTASNAPGGPAPMTCGPATASLNDLADRGREQVRNGRFAEAEACFLRARGQSSGTAQWTDLGSLYWDWAEDLHAAGKGDESKRRLAQSAAAFEGAFNDPGLLANLALAQLLDGDLATAEANATKAQAAAPDDAVTKSLLKVIAEVKAGRRPRPKRLPIPALD